MTVYTGAQDPTVTPTFGEAYEDRFDRSNGTQYVKGEPSGTNTSWFQTSAPAPSATEPDTYVVDAEGGGQFTDIQSAIDQAVADGASTADPKAIKIYPGTYPDPFTVPDGINFSAPAGGVIVTGAATIEGTCSFAGILGSIFILGGGVNLDGDSLSTGNTVTFKYITILSSPLAFSQTLNNSVELSFDNCFISTGSDSTFETTNPLVQNVLRMNKCRVGSGLIIDGRFRIYLDGVDQSGFAFPGTGLVITNNDLLGGGIFIDSAIAVVNSLFRHIECSFLSALPPYFNNCTVANFLPPFSGEALHIEQAAAIFVNSVLGDPFVSSPVPLVNCETGQLVGLKSRFLTDNVGIFLDAASVAQLYSDEIAASGIDRAIDGLAGSTVILSNTLFINDNRINPLVGIINQGSLAMINAGTDVSAPVSPGYTVA